MEHLLLKAAITAATDEGTFTAVISTVAVDRDQDIVEPSAVVNAIHKWAPTGKKIPLAWNHSTKNPEDIVGHIEPDSAKAIDGGRVVVDGWVDQSFDRGVHTWRLVKSGTLGFSYGYLITKADNIKGGGLHIKELDIFEITATPIPANAETQVLAFKSAEELREAARDIAHAVEDSLLPVVEPAEPEPRVDVPKELQEVKAMLAEMGDQIASLTKKVEETDQETNTKSRSVDPLQDNAMKAALGVLSSGAKAPRVEREVPKPMPDLEPEELRRASHDLMVRVLSGSET